MIDNLDEFTAQYIEAALWSVWFRALPLNANYSATDIHPATLAEMVADCTAFQRDHAADIATDPSRAGLDFWLTRNGHGAGFWDGGWDDEAGNRLTTASHAYGEYNLFVGDDGMLHSS